MSLWVSKSLSNVVVCLKQSHAPVQSRFIDLLVLKACYLQCVFTLPTKKGSSRSKSKGRRCDSEQEHIYCASNKQIKIALHNLLIFNIFNHSSARSTAAAWEASVRTSPSCSWPRSLEVNIHCKLTRSHQRLISGDAKTGAQDTLLAATEIDCFTSR